MTRDDLKQLRDLFRSITKQVPDSALIAKKCEDAIELLDEALREPDELTLLRVANDRLLDALQTMLFDFGGFDTDEERLAEFLICRRQARSLIKNEYPRAHLMNAVALQKLQSRLQENGVADVHVSFKMEGAEAPTDDVEATLGDLFNKLLPGKVTLVQLRPDEEPSADGESGGVTGQSSDVDS